MAVEITIKVSNSERSITQKHLWYDENGMMLAKGNDMLREYVEQTVALFKDEVDDVVVKTRMEW